MLYPQHRKDPVGDCTKNVVSQCTDLCLSFAVYTHYHQLTSTICTDCERETLFRGLISAGTAKRIVCNLAKAGSTFITFMTFGKNRTSSSLLICTSSFLHGWALNDHFWWIEQKLAFFELMKRTEACSIESFFGQLDLVSVISSCQTQLQLCQALSAT